MKEKNNKAIFIIHNFKELSFVKDVEFHIQRNIKNAFDV